MDNQVSQYQSLPGNMLYNNLIANIEQGQIKIPQFQRKFVWSIEETAGLIDSILKGYPIGTFIIWETNDRLRSIRNIGNFQFPDTPDGNTVQYVLDGQQRMTSLYVALRGAKLRMIMARLPTTLKSMLILPQNPEILLYLLIKQVIKMHRSSASLIFSTAHSVCF